MLNFLGLGKIQLIVAGAMVTALVVMSGVIWILRADLETSTRNEAVAMAAVAQQAAATQAAVSNAQEWQEALQALQQNMEKLTAVQAAAAQETRRLNGIFNEHDLGALAAARPGLVQRRINSGSDDAFSVLREATGGEHGTSGAGDAAESDPATPAAD